MREDEFDSVFDLMRRSFPAEEYRGRGGQQRLVGRDDYRIYVDVEGQAVRAFLAVFEFEDFIFIEHFAVDPAFRNQGLGAAVLRGFMQSAGKPLCLEVELPDTPLAARRIGFYTRSGFVFNDYDYAQPPLRDGARPLPLRIMSSPGPLSEREFERVRAVLYSRVYGAE